MLEEKNISKKETKDFITHGTVICRSMNFTVASVCLVYPKCKWMIQSSPDRHCTHCGFQSQLSNPNLGTLLASLILWEHCYQTCLICPNIIFIALIRKHTHPLSQWETLYLSSKACFYASILEKYLWNRDVNASCSEDGQKCKRHWWTVSQQTLPNFRPQIWWEIKWDKMLF